MSDTARVQIFDDYYLHEQFDVTPRSCWSEADVYEVPREQVERWEAARDAWEEAQQEMAALMKARHEKRMAAAAEQRQREDVRRAEIRTGLYGARRRPSFTGVLAYLADGGEQR